MSIKVTQAIKMARGKASTRNRTFFITGLILVAAGILLSVTTALALAGLFGVSLQLGGTESLVRIWVLKIVCLTTGLPLLLYRYRAHPQGKVFFDAAVGLLFVLVLLLFIEGLFFVLNRAKPAAPGPAPLATTFSDSYVEPDAWLGYKLKPSVKITATQKSGEDIIYEHIYATDEQRRRVTPVAESPETRDQFILFFGGSFTFGDGLAAAETLPAAVGRAAPAIMPYNYGVSGYGTQQMLARLQQGDMRSEVEQAAGAAVYTFICPHINRVAGSMSVMNTWGSVMPNYILNSGGELVRHGNFSTGRPALSVIYAALGISQTARYFNVNIPRLNNSHYRLTARVIQESARAFEQQFGSDDFYALIYPGNGACAGPLTPHLDQLGLKYFDYSDLIARSDEGMWQPDGHPTATAQKIVAGQLAADLGLTEAKE